MAINAANNRICADTSRMYSPDEVDLRTNQLRSVLDRWNEQSRMPKEMRDELLKDAALFGEVKYIKTLLTIQPNTLTDQTRGQAALQAAQFGHFDCVQEILKNGSVPADVMARIHESYQEEEKGILLLKEHPEEQPKICEAEKKGDNCDEQIENHDNISELNTNLDSIFKGWNNCDPNHISDRDRNELLVAAAFCGRIEYVQALLKVRPETLTQGTRERAANLTQVFDHVNCRRVIEESFLREKHSCPEILKTLTAVAVAIIAVWRMYANIS